MLYLHDVGFKLFMKVCRKCCHWSVLYLV